MFARLFRPAPLFPDASRQWMRDAFDWCLRNLDAREFQHHTALVLPTNTFFGGAAEGVEAKAQLVFGHVQRHAGLQRWPVALAHGNLPTVPTDQAVVCSGPLRGEEAQILVRDNSGPLWVGYEPGMLANPQALICYFALQLSQRLAGQAKEPPPGGPEMWPQLLEVVSVFLGFGVISANSAYTYRRTSCGGSCQKTAVDRPAFLTPYEICYVLALFSQHKGLNTKAALPYLNPALRSFYKKAWSEANRHGKPDTRHGQALLNQQN